ncbi:MAG: GIY-YIG nuclease family protein [bacterium]|nr:MAG: GIY-YIG nuclease family protein [bacterium]
MIENKKNSDVFWIYILECDNGNYYTGYTKDLPKRYQQHLDGVVKYTRSFKPIRIAQCWQLLDEVGMALKIERFIKKQDRKIKEILINYPEKLKSLLVSELDLKSNIYPINPLEIK